LEPAQLRRNHPVAKATPFLLQHPPRPPSPPLFPYTTLFRSLQPEGRRRLPNLRELSWRHRVLRINEKKDSTEPWKDFGKNLELLDRKSTRLNSSHLVISYAVFCLKK